MSGPYMRLPEQTGAHHPSQQRRSPGFPLSRRGDGSTGEISYGQSQYQTRIYENGSSDAMLDGHKFSTVRVEENSPSESKWSVAGGDRPLKREFWNPFWLRAEVLLGFTLWFLCLMMAAVALFVVSNKNIGLGSEVYSKRYLWTFGPTAIFVLSMSLWMHVDFWCKQLTPWARMRKSATPSNLSILQDYFSPFTISTFWRSLKERDYAVWLSTFSVILLQLAIIVSTSLIALESLPVGHPAALTISQTFVSAPPNISTGAATGDSLIKYYGVQAEDLAYPIGTSSNLTVERTFRPGEYADNTTLTTNVAGMSASLECEPLPVSNVTDTTFMPWISIQAPFFTINITTPTCNISGVTVGMGLNHGPPHVDVLSSFQGWWSNYTCNDGVVNSQYSNRQDDPEGWKPVIPGFNDNRLVMITSYLQWTPDQMQTKRSTWVQNYTGIICKPRYSIDSYKLRVSPERANSHDPFHAERISGTSRQINGIANDDLVPFLKAEASRATLLSAARAQRDFTLVTSTRGFLRPDDPMWILMAKMLGDAPMSALSNQTTLLDVAPRAFSGTMAQVFGQYFTMPAQNRVDGSISVYQNRVKVKGTPIAIVLTFLGLLICTSILLQFFKPMDAVPSDPHSIAASAKILAASPELSKDLQTLIGLDDKQIRERIGGRAYQMVLEPKTQSFSIVPVVHQETVRHDAALQRGVRAKWWTPSAQKTWFAILVIAAPLALIAALQIVQHYSDKNQGIVDVTNIDSRKILINLIPAAVMSLVLATYTSLGFTTSLTAPFHALQKGGVASSKGLTVTLLGKTSIHVLFLGLKHRLFLPCLTALAVMIGSFLAIVVSSLYTIDRVSWVGDVNLVRADFFNFTQQDLSLYDGLAGVTTKLIYRENLTYPQWTYDNLVFPKIRFADQVPAVAQGSFMTIEVPAIRPTLECFASDPANVNWERVVKIFNDSDTITNWTTPIQAPCFLNRTEAYCEDDFMFSQIIDPTASTFTIGRGLDAVPDCMAQISNSLNSSAATDTNYQKQEGCPSLSFGLGTTSFQMLNASGTAQPNKPLLYAFQCYAHIDQVQTRVTLSLPDLLITPSNPPVPIDTTARRITFRSPTGDYIGPIYQNSIQTLLDALDGPNINVDPIIDALIHGRNNNTDVTKFLGSGNNNNTKDVQKLLSDAAQDLYSTYLVQAISNTMRSSLSSSSSSISPRQSPATTNPTVNTIGSTSPPQSYTATLIQPTRQRLIQKAGTKTALQVILGIMSSLAILTYVFRADRNQHRHHQHQHHHHQEQNKPFKSRFSPLISSSSSFPNPFTTTKRNKSNNHPQQQNYRRQKQNQEPSTTKSLLPLNPCSIAGTMSLLAGSEMASRKFIPVGSEWETNDGIWEGWGFSLGWWRNRSRDSFVSSPSSPPFSSSTGFPMMDPMDSSVLVLSPPPSPPSPSYGNTANANANVNAWEMRDLSYRGAGGGAGDGDGGDGGRRGKNNRERGKSRFGVDVGRLRGYD